MEQPQCFKRVVSVCFCWGGPRGGSDGSVEPPKLNVKTYNKRMVKKKVNQLSS